MRSELKILVAERLGKSFLKNAYGTHPFKVAPVGEFPDNPALDLMIRSSSPGILDKDDYYIEVNLNPNCSLNLQTQSYQRIFRMENGATQHMVVNMAANSKFSYIPHPLVPHENSIFLSQTTINMAEGCSLLWGEIITCGRKLSGEEFKFTSLRNLLNIYRQTRLIFKDHLILCPRTTLLNKIGLFENYTHQATLVFLPNNFTPSILDYLHEYFLKNTDVTAGLSEIAAKGILVRILGFSGEQLFDMLRQIANNLQSTLVNHKEMLPI